MMIKISTKDDLQKVNNKYVQEYIKDLLKYLLNEYQEYCTDGSISSVGAIFYIEEAQDLEQYHEMGLYSPVNKLSFEWIMDIGNEYKNGCIVISTDFAINVIASNSIFRKVLEDKNEHY